MKRLLFSLAAGLILTAIFLGAPVRASDGQLPPTQPFTQGKALYDKVPLWQFTVDQATASPDSREAILHVNNLLVAKAWLLHTAIRTAEYAVSSTLLETVFSPAAGALRGISLSFQESPWLTAGLALTGLTALLLWLSAGRRTRAYRSLLAAVVILGLNAWLVSYAEAILKTGVTLPAEIAAVGMQPVARMSGILIPERPGPADLTPSQALVRAAGEGLWKRHVIDPWVFLEFGTEAYANRYTLDQIAGGQLLVLPPSQRLDRYYQHSFEDRRDIFRWWNEDYLVRRTVVAGGSLLLTAVTAVPLLLLAGSILLYQLLFIVGVTLAPFGLTLALIWPGAAERIARRIWLRALGAVVMPVVLGLVLSVLLLLVTLVAQMGGTWGWTLTGLFHALAGVAAWRYRNDWLRLLSPRRHTDSRQEARKWPRETLVVPAPVRSPSGQGDHRQSIVVREYQSAEVREKSPALKPEQPAQAIAGPREDREEHLPERSTSRPPYPTPFVRFSEQVRLVRQELEYTPRRAFEQEQLPPVRTAESVPPSQVPWFAGRHLASRSGVPKQGNE